MRRCKRLVACSLVATDQTHQHLQMMSSDEGGRTSLVDHDLATGKTRPLHADPDHMADLAGVVQLPATGQVVFASYDLPYRHNAGLHAVTKTAQRDIAARFGENNISIAIGALDRPWLITESGARLAQARYWLYRRAQHVFTPILQAERLQGAPLPEMYLAAKIALHYRATDGTMLHGYLSLPPGKNAASVPLMTMVHAGPWYHVDADYQSLVQLLVNRGVAVFQPNFRASTGYGERYLRAPGADFGNGMVQRDIIDGVRYLLANGVGDSRRLAIMGDSFGGYSTLMALTHTPTLFQFGLATVPPPDFAAAMRTAASVHPGEGKMPFATNLADLGIDIGNASQMQAIGDSAPVRHVASLGRPLVLLAGARDDKVPIASINDYVARLQEARKPVTLLIAPDEGHNLRKPLTRLAYVYLLEQLLASYLGSPAPAAPSADLAAYLQQTIKVNDALPHLPSH